MMAYEKPEVTVAAEYICIQLHPEDLRLNYVRDIRVFYSADDIVYVLQALSSGMTAIFVGLLTNYLYDKTKRPDKQVSDITALLTKQEKRLQELEALLNKRDRQAGKSYAAQQLELHRQTVLRVQDSDPKIAEMVEDAIRQLQNRGQKALAEEVDSPFK